LPEKIEVPERNDKVFATRIDMFASGDGGALNNNRTGVPGFVRKVKMGDKDYKFRVQHLLPPPSSNAVLKYIVKKQKGDTLMEKWKCACIPRVELG